MLNNFVNFEYVFTKLLGIDPFEKRINRLGGHAWRHFFMACSRLEAMAIYVVKQACGNDIMTCVYGGFQLLDLIIMELKSHMTCYNPMLLIG